MDAMKQFPDGFFDLAIVDPPYGLKIGSHAGGKVYGAVKKPSALRNAGFKVLDNFRNAYHTFNDEKPPSKEYFDELKRVAKNRIIWGGNYFLDYLGKTSCIITWDKGRRNMDQADCEIAWTDLKDNSRIVNYIWNGLLQENMKDKEARFHPTQKPVGLYSWLLAKYARPGMKILDTHAGSASSLVACRLAGLDAWGFEIDPVYFEKAKARLDAAQAQVTINDLISAAEEQTTMDALL